MYGNGTGAAAAGGGVTTLASTGLDAFWVVVTAVALIMAGVVLTRLRPKEEY